MRLANGIIIDKEKTFGVLKFSALRREVHMQNEDGTVSEEIKERTYDLKCKEQGRMIQVSIPATVPLKEFDYNDGAELKYRARQNVVFEHGYLIGKLERKNVCALVKNDVEKPNDISGVVYISYDESGAWKIEIAKELKAAGYNIDFNKLF